MKLLPILAAVLLSTGLCSAQSVRDSLLSGFEDPPNSARPRVWWHWMNGNVTQEGIDLDLQWMHRIGLGGFQDFDAAMNTPQVVDHRLVYMSPEWKKIFLHATKLADKLGLEESIASSPGWSETGGPWVPAAEGMKKYVWSETTVEGGKPFQAKLAVPPSATGPFQDIPLVPDPVAPGDKPPRIPADFYRDSAVFAYRTPDVEFPADKAQPTITTSSGLIDASHLADGDYAKSVDLPSAPVGQRAWILYDYKRPVTIQSVMLVLANPEQPPVVSSHHGDSLAFLEDSDDGVNFRVLSRLDAGDIGIMEDIAPVTARYFRVAFLATPAPPVPALEDDPDGWMGIHANRTAAPHYERITELVLSPAPRVNHLQDKAAFTTDNDLYRWATRSIAPIDAIDKSQVVDLTSKMQADGTLTWAPPPGRWTVVRLGYSLLGITNHPATAEATGLEVDKLNRVYVQHYLDNYLDSYKKAVGPEWMGRRGIQYVVTDSWEAGAQNWTDNMLTEFRKRRGYEPLPWLPVLTGHIVESAQASDSFLWDFRRTIEDLIADEHYGQVQASLNARGLGHYGESHEGGRALIADGMEVKKLDEVPMSAMWTQSPGVNDELYGYNADDRESASVAHIYGQNLAAAESMTAVHAPWAWSPATLKPTADKELAEGINRFVIHCSVHQPLIGKAPGLGLGPYGQWFNRNETWAEEAKPWVDYLSRNAYMLQQGRFAADVLYYYGEDSNITAIFGGRSPAVPEGYGFDYVNADALRHMFKVDDHKITTASGMRYSLLVLDPYSIHMSLPVLLAIRGLVRDGAILAGPRPVGSPSLADDPGLFEKAADELWGNATGPHSFGLGRVYAGMTAAEALQAMKLDQDFGYTRTRPDTNVLFVHRKLPEGEIYFVDNRGDREETINATFRVDGYAPELWHADTGKTEPASYSMENERTTVPLRLSPWETVLVVFRSPSTIRNQTLPAKLETNLATLDGPWKITFQPYRGAPPTATFNTLTPWNENPDTGIRYFSGTGNYTKSIVAAPGWFKPGAHLWIDLGDVKNLAIVTVNGKPLGTVWHSPFRIDATNALLPGVNTISVQVTNAWVNRIIGDLQPDATAKYTFTVIRPYAANSPLLPSGLLGPVTIQSISAASQH